MEGCKQFIRNIGEAPVTSLFTTSTVVVLADMARTMFELSGNAAIVAGVDGVVVYVNPVAEKLTGTRPQDAVGKPLANSILLSNPKTGEAKIDGAFVREMLADRVGLGMVESIHRIGKILGMKTIAACVESAEAFARIKPIGVDYAQGSA